MVNTRSRFNRESRIEQSGTSSYSDNEDNMSVADHFGENVLGNEFENDMREIERDHENHRFEQRFLEMNRQIGELTNIVKALTDRLSNSREENNRDVPNPETSARSVTERIFFFGRFTLVIRCTLHALISHYNSTFTKFLDQINPVHHLVDQSFR